MRLRIFRKALLGAGLAAALTSPAASEPLALEPFEQNGLAGVAPKGWTESWSAADRLAVFRPTTRARPTPFLAVRAMAPKADIEPGPLADWLSRRVGLAFQPVKTEARGAAKAILFRGPDGVKAAAVLVRRREGSGFAIGWAKSPGFERVEMLRAVAAAAKAARPLRPPSRPSPTAPARPEPGPGAARGPAGALWVGLKFDPASTFTGGTGVRQYQYLLLPDGTAFRGTPPGGRLNWTADGLRRIAPARLGRWSRDAGGVTLRFRRPDGQPARPIQLTAAGTDLMRGETRLSRVRCPRGPITGEYKSFVGRSIGLAGPGPTISAASAKRIRFGSDGRFAFLSSSGAIGRSGGAGATSTARSAAEGVYRIEGCRLALRADGGATGVSTIFRWPGETRMIAIDGRLYVKPKPRR